MNSIITIKEVEQLPSPALLFSEEGIEHNLDRMLAWVAGDASRLRPHMKTHKCAEILKLQSKRGIQRVKCSTIAEAELAARCGCPDVLVAYPMLGPNVQRFHQLRTAYPSTQFSCLVDSPSGLRALADKHSSPSVVLIDLDCGMHRTGIAPDKSAFSLIE